MRSHSATSAAYFLTDSARKAPIGCTLENDSQDSAFDLREEALLRQMPFVNRLARHMRRRLPASIELNDLVSAGTIGLMEAMAKFDPERNVDFDRYAKSRIRGAMVDSLRALDWSPRPLRRMGRTVEETVQALTARLRRTPDEFEIAAEMGLNIEDYHKLTADLHGLGVETLNKERHEGSGEDEIELLPAATGHDSLQSYLKGELTTQLTSAIELLPERERLVVTLFYFEEMNLREIAMTIGVCQSRASQIHATAVSRLRAVLEGLPDRRTCKGRRRRPSRHMAAAALAA
jgi:RNA polymerase sigma factor FliA